MFYEDKKQALIKYYLNLKKVFPLWEARVQYFVGALLFFLYCC